MHRNMHTQVESCIVCAVMHIFVFARIFLRVSLFDIGIAVLCFFSHVGDIYKA